MKCQFLLQRIGIVRTLSTLALLLTLNAVSGQKAVGQTPDSGSDQALQQGKPVSREITEGQTHSYRIALKPGEFLHVVIKQLGVNVAASLFGPDGTKILDADIPVSTEEPEWITYVAPMAGVYSINVRKVDKAALAGTYEIKIGESRESNTDDQLRLTAQRAFTEATRLFNERNYKASIEKYEQALAAYRQSRRQFEEAVVLNCLARSSAVLNDFETAITRFNEALSIYVAVDDLFGQGMTLQGIGNVYLNSSKYDSAISNLERARNVRQKSGYRAGEAASLRGLAIAYSLMGRQQNALEHFEKALEIFRELKDIAWEGRTLSDIGLVYNTLSQYEKAIGFYEKALAISRQLKDRSGEGRAIGNLAKVYADLTYPERSIEYSEQALVVYRELKDRRMEAIALNNIGVSYNKLSQYEKAIENLEQALTISREEKDQSNEGRVLTNLGTSYNELAQYDKAIMYYQQALDLRRLIKDRKGEGLTLGNLSHPYLGKGEYARAKEILEQALTIKIEVKDRSGEGYTLNSLGAVYQNLAQYQRAMECFAQALAIGREVKDRISEADSLWGLGHTNYLQGLYDKALDDYQQSLAISREVKNVESEGRALHELMSTWDQLNNQSVAILYGKQSVKKFQEIRNNIKTLDSAARLTYLKSHEDTYRKLANLLVAQGRLAEAERVLELLKEEEFNRIIRRNSPVESDIRLTKTETEAVSLSEQLAQLASERGPLLDKIANGTATDQDRERLGLIATAITGANEKIRLVLEEIAKTSSDDSLVIQQSRSMMQTLRKLGAGTVALYTVVTKEKGWVILTTPDFRRAYPIDTTNLNQTISDFRLTLTTADHDPVPLARKLYRALFLQKNKEGATLAADLRAYRATTLMWSLDGGLRYLPINALHNGKDYLIGSYSNLVFTPASLTRLLDAPEKGWRGFGLGVSKQHQNFLALAFVPAELRSIIREAGVADSKGVLPGVIRLDEQFTRQAMIDGLHKGYAVVHIASHFMFIPEREELSYLLLGDGTTLSVQEMENSPGIFERVELLTLSACETGLGSNGKEVEGMAFVAQDLGAKAVVASLWPVSDEGTAVLMREFYRLKQQHPRWSKAQALRQAEIALLTGNAIRTSQATEVESSKVGEKVPTAESGLAMNRYQRDPKAPFAHPHYWAPFILIGNWR